MESAWIPVIAALGGAGIGALNSLVPASMEYLRAKRQDEANGERVQRDAEAARRGREQDAISECVLTAARFITLAEGNSLPNGARPSREDMMGARARARLFVGPREQAMIDQVLRAHGEHDSVLAGIVRTAVHDLVGVSQPGGTPA